MYWFGIRKNLFSKTSNIFMDILAILSRNSLESESVLWLRIKEISEKKESAMHFPGET